MICFERKFPHVDILMGMERSKAAEVFCIIVIVII